MSALDNGSRNGQTDSDRLPNSDDARMLEDGVAIGNIPVLLMILVQLTGEMRWLEPPYKVSRPRGLGDNDSGGLPDEIQDEIREAARDAILAWRQGRPMAIPNPSSELLVRMLSWSMGQEVDDEYAHILRVLNGLDTIFAEPIDNVPEGFTAIVIGAGMHGVAMAVNLQAAGVPFTLLERNNAAGGVWLENRYPGAGVDSPSLFYEYLFAPYDWSRYFAMRDELSAYFADVVERFGLGPSIQFGVTVEAATYDAEAQEWEVDIRRADGATETLRTNVLISAAGIFNPPKFPDIPGRETFQGVSCHTARWRDEIVLEGKRVAMIGTGASSMQFCPEVQNVVGSLTIFQRENMWVAPFEQFQKAIPQPIRYLLTHLPLYRNWYRTRLGWTFNDQLHGSLQKDPSWPHPERSLNARNDAHREFFTKYMINELGDRTDLLDLVVPDYPPFGKRILMDNRWFQMLKNQRVTLVSGGLQEIRPHSVVAADGREFDVDVLVYGTGFDVLKYLSSYEVRGRSGRTLRDTWGDDNARAYVGTCVPDFPNFFVLYGPNTQPGHGGSVIFGAEMTIRYVIDAIRRMITDGIGALEVREDVFEAYNDAVDRAHANMVYTHQGMRSYYRNSQGRCVVNNPFKTTDFFRRTLAVDLDDFLIETRVAPADPACLSSESI